MLEIFFSMFFTLRIRQLFPFRQTTILTRAAFLKTLCISTLTVFVRYTTILSASCLLLLQTFPDCLALLFPRILSFANLSMSSSTESSSLFCLRDVYQIKYYKAKYLEISAKQSKGQANQRYGNSLRQVCRQGQECRRWNSAHLEIWRWWKYWLWTWTFPSMLERE